MKKTLKNAQFAKENMTFYVIKVRHKEGENAR